MARAAVQPDPAETDDRSFAGAEALPARFADTLERLRSTRARVARMRAAVHAAGAIGRSNATSADLAQDDGAHE